jgi:hypothetical protein
MDMGPRDAYLLDNAKVTPQGLEIRKGYRSWLPDEDLFANPIKTIMPYVTGTGTDKLFAAESDSASTIWDVTTPNSAPSISHTPATPATNPGVFSYTMFVTAAQPYLIAVAEGAGVFKYDGTSWAEIPTGGGAGQIQFPGGDPTTTKDLAFVWVWKNRLWFCKKESPVAYFLPTGQFAGTLSAQDFGPQFIHGGYLYFGASWTYDSGSGVDDGLILASTNGDILLYQGTDPTSATDFQLKGVFYAGRPPIGRRSFCTHGGDLLLVTEYGIVSMSDLVSGRLHTAQITGSLGYKVNPVLSSQVSRLSDQEFWFLLPFPTEEILFLGSPLIHNILTIRQSYIMNSITNAWSTVSDLNLLCGDLWEGKMIAGDRDGQVVHAFTGSNDGVSSDGSVVGAAVTARMQGSFLGYDSDTQNKRALRVKVYGLADGVPTFYATMKSEYDLKQLISVPSPVDTTAAVWDSALWDGALWDSFIGSFHKWFGVSGFGKKLSLQMAMRGSGPTIFTDYEFTYEVGIGL